MDNRAADLLENATRNERVLRRFQQFELQLLDTSGLEELLIVLLRTSLSFFELNAAELWLFDPEGILAELISDDLHQFRGLELHTQRRQLDSLYGEDPTVRLLSSGNPDRLPVFNGLQLRSAALLPLQRRDALVGSLHLGDADRLRFRSDKSTDFMAHLARIVAVCLESAVNQDRLKRLSMRDALTQINNRRAFHLALESEVSRASRNGSPLSLLIVDLDHFKSVNDLYGHPMGDKVLKRVAQFMQAAMRKIDHVCRYGGEEFAVILPQCSQEKAGDIAERLRIRVSQLWIENEESITHLGENISVTLSIGGTCWLPADHPMQVDEARIAKALISSADKGVYRAKSGGRNRVSFVTLYKNAELRPDS